MPDKILVPESTDWLGRLAKAETDILALQTAPRSMATSIVGGNWKVLDLSKNRRVQMGLQDDASYGITIYDQFGNPLITNSGQIVKDSLGNTRVIVGKDPGDGSYGIKVYTDAGDLQFDTNGQRKGMTRVGFCDASPQNQAIALNGVNNFDVAGANTTITLARAQELRLVAFFTGYTAGAVGQFAYLSTYIGPNFAGKTFQTGSLIWDKTMAGYQNYTMETFLPAQAAGTFRFCMTIFGDNGQTFQLYQSHLDIYQVGA